jgi:hypothetical protein
MNGTFVLSSDPWGFSKVLVSDDPRARWPEVFLN